MEHFTGRLNDGRGVVFERVVGTLADAASRSGRRCGQLEVHQGGVLGGGHSLPLDGSYHLELGDGRVVPIRLTTVHASNSAGIAVLEFEGDGEWPGPNRGPT